MQPLVSVVVPVFNGMTYLPQLIDSLSKQAYPNLEIVISEGGGTDGSLEYLQSLGMAHLSITSMPPGTSAAENWTAATLAARGSYIKLVCQDDVIYPNALREQTSDLLANPSAVMAVARRDIIDADGKVRYRERGFSGIPRTSDSLMAGAELIRRCYLAGTNIMGEPLDVLFRAEELKAAMPWNDSNPLMLDLSMYQKVAPLGDVVLRWNAVGAFRVSTRSWSTRLAREQRAQTLRWQEEYERTASPAPSPVERFRARVATTYQVGLRRAAYTALKLRGSLS